MWPRQTVSDTLRGGRSKICDEVLSRSANAFNVNEVGLRAEFWDLGGIAAAHFDNQQVSTYEVWTEVARRTSTAASRKSHPISNLEIVLAEYFTISASA